MSRSSGGGSLGGSRSSLRSDNWDRERHQSFADWERYQNRSAPWIGSPFEWVMRVCAGLLIVVLLLGVLRIVHKMGSSQETQRGWANENRAVRVKQIKNPLGYEGELTDVAGALPGVSSEFERVTGVRCMLIRTDMSGDFKVRRYRTDGSRETISGNSGEWNYDRICEDPATMILYETPGIDGFSYKIEVGKEAAQVIDEDVQKAVIECLRQTELGYADDSRIVQEGTKAAAKLLSGEKLQADEPSSNWELGYVAPGLIVLFVGGVCRVYRLFRGALHER